MAQYGYIRVSSKEQNLSRQIIAMEEFGIDEKNIYKDKMSGKDFNRPSYKRLVRKLKPEDVVVIKSIDRLGRNYEEIIEQWKYLHKIKRVSIVVLDMPLLDTRNDKDLMGRLISDIVLQLLSYVAQTEREMIKQRQREGIDAALARGVKFGREKINLPNNFNDAKELFINGNMTMKQAAKYCNMKTSTFYKYAKLKQKLIFLFLLH